MPVFLIGMALVGAALMAAGASLWLNGSASHSIPESGSPPSSPKTDGRSAISHGGPSPQGTTNTPGSSPAPFVVGQHVILDQPVVVSPSSQPAMLHTLSPGTEMVVSGVAIPRTEQKERYYDLTSSDRATIRVPERALRARDAGMGGP